MTADTCPDAEKAALAEALKIIEERTVHLPGWAVTDSAADVFLGELWAVAHKALADLSPAAKEILEKAQAHDAMKAKAEPFCRKWGVFIPSLEGPYGHGWEAHETCGPYHVLMIQFDDARAAIVGKGPE